MTYSSLNQHISSFTVDRFLHAAKNNESVTRAVKIPGFRGLLESVLEYFGYGQNITKVKLAQQFKFLVNDERNHRTGSPGDLRIEISHGKHNFSYGSIYLDDPIMTGCFRIMNRLGVTKSYALYECRLSDLQALGLSKENFSKADSTTRFVALVELDLYANPKSIVSFRANLTFKDIRDAPL